jgi:hypothetical protein
VAVQSAGITVNGDLANYSFLHAGAGNLRVWASNGDIQLQATKVLFSPGGLTNLEVTSDGLCTSTGVQLVGTTRKTGWTAATGTATRSTFATGSVTTAQLAEHVKALIDDLIAHGLIGA